MLRNLALDARRRRFLSTLRNRLVVSPPLPPKPVEAAWENEGGSLAAPTALVPALRIATSTPAPDTAPVPATA
ncbi:MAG: hypothetical protein JNJ82_06190 [Opitutaceae bacterium]|nr:hypothetical protein [Opitutaceae bacterium]